MNILLKPIQTVTGKNVYTLLLNVEYIPIIKTWNLGDLIEFALHGCVSVVLVIVLYYSLKRFNLHQKSTIYILTNLIVGVLLYGTTVLSSRTPELLDVTAFSYWIIGHVLYGSDIGLVIKLVKD